MKKNGPFRACRYLGSCERDCGPFVETMKILMGLFYLPTLLILCLPTLIRYRHPDLAPSPP